MAASQRQMAELELRLRDFVSKEMKRMGRNVKREATQMEKAWKGVKRAMVGVGLALKVAFAAAAFKGMRTGIRRAFEFSHAMSEVRTIMDETSMSFSSASKNVSDLALELGRSEIEVAKSLYQTLSAGVTDTADAMLMLNQSGRLAVASLMTTNEATDLLTNTFNAYGMVVNDEALTATSDLMQQTVKLGKVIGSELAHSLGYVMPIASNLGVSLKELNAMLAALTLGGMNASMAATQLRQAMSQLLNPTDDAADLLREYNVEISAVRVQAEGFLPVLRDIRDTFGGNAKAIQTLFPNIRGMIGVMALAGNQFDDVQRIMGEFNNAAGATDVAFGKMQASLQVKMSKLKEAWAQAWKEIGNAMTGALEGMTVEEINERADAIRAIGEANAEGFEKIGTSISASVAHIAASITPMTEFFDDLSEPTFAFFKAYGDGWDAIKQGDVVGAASAMWDGFTNSTKMALGPLNLLLKETEKTGDVIESFDYTNVNDGARENINLLIAETQKQRGYAVALAESARFTNDMTDAGVEYREGLAQQIKEMGGAVDMWRNTLNMMDKFSQASTDVVDLKMDFEASLTLHGPGSEESQAILKELQGTIDQFVADGGLVADLNLTANTQRVLAEDKKRLKQLQDALKEENMLRDLYRDIDLANYAEFSEIVLREAQGDLRDLTEARVEASEAALATSRFFFKLEKDLGGQSLQDKKSRIDLEELMDMQAFENKRDAAWIAYKDDKNFDLLSVHSQVEASEAFRRTWDQDTEYYKALLGKRSDKQKKELDKEAENLKSFGAQIKGLLEDAWDRAGGAIKRSWKETLRDLKKATAEDVGGLFEATGMIASLVSPTANDELLELQTTLSAARQQLHLFQSLAAQGLMPVETVYQLQANIENFREFALQEAIAAEQTERLGFALRDVAGKGGLELSEALNEAGSSISVLANMHVPVAAEQLQNLSDHFEIAKEQIEALRNQDLISPEQATELTRMVTEVYKLEYATLAAADAADKLNQKWRDQGTTWDTISDSFSAGVASWGEGLGTMNEQVQELGDSFAEGIHGAIMQFVSDADDASQAWKNFAKSFLLEIASMILKQMLLNALVAWGEAFSFMFGGFASGGVVDGGTGDMTPLASGGVVAGGLGRALPVRGYATGGPIVNKPHVALIGEGSMNEAVVPLPDGKSIPVQMQGGGGAEISVNIQAVDAKGVDELLFQRQDTLRNIVRQALQEDYSFRSALGRG